MKKLISLLAVVLFGTATMFAQTDLVATLSHNSSLSTFFGANALAEAHQAAEDGDIITLSPGVFEGTTIEKAVTVRGVGMKKMECNGYMISQIRNGLTINVPSNASSVPTIESLSISGGVSISGNNLAPVNIYKCWVGGSVSASGVSLTAVHCLFNSLSSTYGSSSSSGKNTVAFCNSCVIAKTYNNGFANNGARAIIKANNCILNCYDLYNSEFTNCILIYSGSLSSTNIVQNCVGIGSSIFEYISDPSNVIADWSIFKTNISSLDYVYTNVSYELTETAASTYLGNDGTQVGIYGGTSPFDPVTLNQQVTTFSVGSSIDGNKLKVKINVQ